jgi:hypothetical protein
MAAGRCECICTHNDAKNLGGWPGVKKGSKEATSLQEKHQGQTDILQNVQTGIGLLRTGVIFSDESTVWASGKKLVRRRQGERYHQSCVMPTVTHPETIHVWVCFSAKEVGSLTILHKNTAMNKEWYQHILREQLLPTIQEQFGDEQCIFQHDGAPCHKAKVITKWLGETNIDILGPWPGNSPDLILKRREDEQNHTNSDKLQHCLCKNGLPVVRMWPRS